ncbi:MAG: M48 family metallopeptidase [Bulleidia sp.]
MAEILYVEMEGKTYPVEVVRRKAKSVVLYVRENGELEVRCPMRTSNAHIVEFVQKKQKWLLNKMAEQNQKQNQMQDGSDGLHAVWMGKEYHVRTVISEKEHIDFESDTMVFHVRMDTPQDRSRLFYHEGGLQLLRWVREDRGKWDADICIANHKPLPRITIRYTTSRWGSCSPKRPSISLSLRLIHFPKECFDYVLLHEYAHMLVCNHSKAFYEEIEKRMPEYRDCEKLLR